MDETGCTRLAAKIVILALRDAKNGDLAAEEWFVKSQQAGIFLDGLGLFVDRLAIIKKVKFGNSADFIQQRKRK